MADLNSSLTSLRRYYRRLSTAILAIAVYCLLAVLFDLGWDVQRPEQLLLLLVLLVPVGRLIIEYRMHRLSGNRTLQRLSLATLAMLVVAVIIRWTSLG